MVEERSRWETPQAKGKRIVSRNLEVGRMELKYISRKIASFYQARLSLQPLSTERCPALALVVESRSYP